MANYTNAERFFYDIKARITLKNNAEYNLTADQIVDYDINGQAGQGCIPVGMTASNSFTLQFDNSTLGFTAAQLDDANVQVWVSKQTDPDATASWQSFGYWYISDVQSSEQSPFCTITGADAISSRFDATFTDREGDYPRTVSTLLGVIATSAGVAIRSTPATNRDYAIAKMPEWHDGVTLRDILGYISTIMGGCARIDYDGRLSIITPGDSGYAHTVNSGYYTEFAEKGGSAFAFNCIQWITKNDDPEAEETEVTTRFVVDSQLEDNATNTIQIRENPLADNTTLTNVKTALTGKTFEGATMSWFGDWAVCVGDSITVIKLDGTTCKMILTGHNSHFSAGGMTAESTSDMPVLTTKQSSGYSGTVTALNPDGSVRVEAISGLDQKIVSAEYGYFKGLTAETIMTEKLLATIIDAVTLRAQTIQATSVSTDKLTAAVAEIIAATVRKIEAGTITADSLAAEMADIVRLKAESITAQSISTDDFAAAIARIITLTADAVTAQTISTDQLAAAIAKIVQLKAGTVTAQDMEVTGSFSAAMAHIVEAFFDTATLSTGIIDTAQIKDAAITTAKIDNAQITEAKIQDAAITTAKIGDAQITSAKIGTGQITTALIQTGAVGTLQIADGSITSAKIISLNADVIEAGTLKADRLIITGTDGLLYEINKEASGLSISELSDDKYKEALNGTVIVAKSVTADQIAAQTITANEIAANTITAGQIEGGSITGQEIAAGTITTGHVTSDFGQTLNLQSNTAIQSLVSAQGELQGDFTAFKQSESQFELTIGQRVGAVETTAQDGKAFAETAKTYFTFGQNGLEIGESGSTMKSRFATDRLSFFNNGKEVAYISNEKLYITDAEAQSFKAGKPGNGYLDFVSVSDGVGFVWRE